MEIKKLLSLAVLLFFCSSAFSQSDKWASISYTYSKGPVSPEYQFNFTITIDNAGVGILSYSKSSITNNYDFSLGKKGMKKLNSALSKSKVFSVNADSMKADNSIIGGPTKNLSVTMWQEPNLDQRPTVIQIPDHVKEKYSANLNDLYNVIENLVPNKVWNKATAQ